MCMYCLLLRGVAYMSAIYNIIDSGNSMKSCQTVHRNTHVPSFSFWFSGFPYNFDSKIWKHCSISLSYFGRNHSFLEFSTTVGSAESGRIHKYIAFSLFVEHTVLGSQCKLTDGIYVLYVPKTGNKTEFVLCNKCDATHTGRKGTTSERCKGEMETGRGKMKKR